MFHPPPSPVSHYGLVACCLLAPPDRPTTGRPADRSRSHIHTLRFSLQSGRKCAKGRRGREWVGCASAEREITKPTLWPQCRQWQWRAGNTLRRPWRKKLHLEIRIKVAEAAARRLLIGNFLSLTGSLKSPFGEGQARFVGVFDVPTQLVHGITLLSGHDLHVAFRLMRGRRKREHLKAFGMGRPMREWWTTNDEVDRGPLYGRSEMKMSFGVGGMNASAP